MISRSQEVLMSQSDIRLTMITRNEEREKNTERERGEDKNISFKLLESLALNHCISKKNFKSGNTK